MDIGEIYGLFPTEATCIVHLEKVRWDDKPVCPYCGDSGRQRPRAAEQRHQCYACNKTYSVTAR